MEEKSQYTIYKSKDSSAYFLAGGNLKRPVTVNKPEYLNTLLAGLHATPHKEAEIRNEAGSGYKRLTEREIKRTPYTYQLTWMCMSSSQLEQKLKDA